MCKKNVTLKVNFERKLILMHRKNSILMNDFILLVGTEFFGFIHISNITYQKHQRFITRNVFW